MGSAPAQSGSIAASTLDRANDLYIQNRVQDLFSLKGRTTVITGGARGIGLALAFAVAEAGSDVAILDILDQPHEHFHLLETGYSVKVKFYK
jgi:pyruvate/2-oxoglutarate dehydrogenase complex dihydrolipoamide dehydrogenase (E3) component